MNQHCVVVMLLQPRFDLSIKVAEERADVSISFDFKKALETIPVPMQIPALVLKRFVAMRGVELVLLLNDHSRFSIRRRAQTLNRLHSGMLMRDISSARLAGSVRNEPLIVLVTVELPVFRIPRIDMHECSARTITPTALLPRRLSMRSAIV